MPRVRILQPVIGTDRNWTEGDIVDMSPSDAEAWADGVRGELVRDEPMERAVRRAPERTVRG